VHNRGRENADRDPLMRLPHPVVLLLAAVGVAAALTWILAPGEFDRRDDASTGRRVVVAGTYHAVPPAPVGPFAAVVAVPRGIVEAADVIAVVLFVGGAWVIVDRLGTLSAVVGALVGRLHARGLLAIPILSTFFAVMGALENMQEEIIPLIPVLLVLGGGLGIDAVSVVAMSAGAAMIGSAFGPTNPFQAGIALKLAQLPPLAGGGLRLTMFIAAVTAWIGWTIRHAARARLAAAIDPSRSVGRLDGRHAAILAAALLPMAAYVYGALRLSWGFNELAGAFLIGGAVAGFIGGLGVQAVVSTFFDGMTSVLPAALMVGVARSISLVMADGRIIDTVLNDLASALSGIPGGVSAFLMVPVQALLHVVVPSVSGQAVLTMPLFVPLADLLNMTRQAPVLAYQTGAGLMEMFTPTNGALMAVLLAAGVPYQRWLRFAIAAAAIPLLIGLAGIATALWLNL
jgi:uncharacterized ion transporter superfamily protein YfcC